MIEKAFVSGLRLNVQWSTDLKLGSFRSRAAACKASKSHLCLPLGGMLVSWICSLGNVTNRVQVSVFPTLWTLHLSKNTPSTVTQCPINAHTYLTETKVHKMLLTSGRLFSFLSFHFSENFADLIHGFWVRMIWSFKSTVMNLLSLEMWIERMKCSWTIFLSVVCRSLTLTGDLGLGIIYKVPGQLC